MNHGILNVASKGVGFLTFSGWKLSYLFVSLKLIYAVKWRFVLWQRTYLPVVSPINSVSLSTICHCVKG